MPTSVNASSGDLLADRRYEYARELAARGDFGAAAELLAHALERAPSFGPAWFALGEARESLGDMNGAVEAFARARGLDTEDRSGAALRLARLGHGDPLAAMQPGYVRAVFDEYAPRFDEALTQDLAYAGPQLLRAAVLEACAALGRRAAFDCAIDLGCGTGLAGAAMSAEIGFLCGVDLSPRMAALARARGCYADVQTSDMLAYLREQTTGSADLVLAADSLVYLADLRPIFAETGRVLKAGGLFALTVETHEGEGVVLGPALRYAHAAQYVGEMLRGAGLTPVVFREASTRTEAGVPVLGLVIVANSIRCGAGALNTTPPDAF